MSLDNYWSRRWVSSSSGVAVTWDDSQPRHREEGLGLRSKVSGKQRGDREAAECRGKERLKMLQLNVREESCFFHLMVAAWKQPQNVRRSSLSQQAVGQLLGRARLQLSRK